MLYFFFDLLISKSKKFKKHDFIDWRFLATIPFHRQEIKQSSGAVTQSTSLFDASSPFFMNTLVSGGIILLVLVSVGVLWDWMWRYRVQAMKKLPCKSELLYITKLN